VTISAARSERRARDLGSDLSATVKRKARGSARTCTNELYPPHNAGHCGLPSHSLEKFAEKFRAAFPKSSLSAGRALTAGSGSAAADNAHRSDRRLRLSGPGGNHRPEFLVNRAAAYPRRVARSALGRAEPARRSHFEQATSKYRKLCPRRSPSVTAPRLLVPVHPRRSRVVVIALSARSRAPSRGGALFVARA
jgi:hypothetical protein